MQNIIRAHVALALVRAAQSAWEIARVEVVNLPLPDAAREDARTVTHALDRLERACIAIVAAGR